MTSPVERDQIVQSLGRSLKHGVTSLETIPDLVRRLLDEEAWKDRVIERTGESVRFQSFVEFVTEPPLEGLGADPQRLLRVCADREDVVRDLKRVLDGEQPLAEHRRPTKAERKVDNSNFTTGGTAEDYTRKRLARDHPDLYTQVLDGDLTANAAAIKAGFRHPTATVRLDSASSAAAVLRKKMSAEQRHELAMLLLEG